MKARDLLPIIERVRRGTSSHDVLTICDALQARLVKEMAEAATKNPPAQNNAPPAPAANLTGFAKRRGPTGTAIAAALERAEARSAASKDKAAKANRKARRKPLQIRKTQP